MTYPSELDTDDIEELASYIERRYPTEEIRIHDTETVHFAYWDKSHRVVSATLLEHIQAAGYRVLHTGVATVPRGETRRAWMECRKDADNTDKTNAITLSCPKCEKAYTTDEARTIAIFGPDDARYTCPRCGHGTDGPPPIPNSK
jgi:predicted RNA-binding Zn-ribbon protein involved in translation (DUF1610 family)